MRRNRTVVAAGSLVALILVVGLVAFAWQWKVATDRADELSQVVDFDSAMFEKIDPAAAGEGLTADVRARFDAALHRAGLANDERVRRLAQFDADWKLVNATDAARGVIGQNVLKPVADSIDAEFGEQPDIAGPLRLSVANRYETMGLYDEAIAQIQIALDRQRKVSAEESPEVAEYEYAMGTLLQQSGRDARAEPYYLATLKTIHAIHGDKPTSGGLTVLGNLGVLYAAEGRMDKAEPIYREVLAGRRKLLGNDDPDTLLSLLQIGGLMRDNGRYREADAYLGEALRGYERDKDADPENVMYAQGNMALLREAQGRGGEAVQSMQQVVERARTTLGESHPTTLLAQVVLGGLLERRGNHAEAERILAPIQAQVRAAWRNDDAFWYGSLLAHLGEARAARGDFVQAETDLLEGENWLARQHAPEEPDDVNGARQGLANLYTAWDRAEPGKGHDTQAAAWERRVVAAGTTSPRR